MFITPNIKIYISNDIYIRTASINDADLLLSTVDDTTTFKFLGFKILDLESAQKFLRESEKESRQCLLIFFKNECVGTTSIYNVTNKDYYIGYTWIMKKVRRSGLNSKVKQFIFNSGLISGRKQVLFTADINNIISRKALEKLGAKFIRQLNTIRVNSDGCSSKTVEYLLNIDKEY